MANQRNIARLMLFVLLGYAAHASTDGWLRFFSSKQFSVLYPQEWVRSGSSTDRLQILSSEGGAEGVIIRRGQAEITVMDAERGSGKSLPQVISEYTEGTSVLSRRDIDGDGEDGGCRDLKEVIARERAIPPADSPIDVPYVVDTGLFCATRGRTIVVLLRNWQGDQRQTEYQQIALEMAKSIRFSQ
jgi:hypothetical protein